LAGLVPYPFFLTGPLSALRSRRPPNRLPVFSRRLDVLLSILLVLVRGCLKGKRSAGSEATENGTLEAGWAWRVGVTASEASAAGYGRPTGRAGRTHLRGGLHLS
jgi:hypothetical protein